GYCLYQRRRRAVQRRGIACLAGDAGVVTRVIEFEFHRSRPRAEPVRSRLSVVLAHSSCLKCFFWSTPIAELSFPRTGLHFDSSELPSPKNMGLVPRCDNGGRLRRGFSPTGNRS